MTDLNTLDKKFLDLGEHIHVIQLLLESCDSLEEIGDDEFKVLLTRSQQALEIYRASRENISSLRSKFETVTRNFC
jgi:hypothetical protein